ncbi:FtsX-like permease family protein [Streptomyces sp. NPDC058953]|uniref:FtsX-like permease family protein n=1 Tax=unclassified Streptomyces TaxID=2593676 RepID=UPI0036C6C678
MNPRTWTRDLALGIRFGASGGREGWIRTLLTAFGVGVGVTMLLLASSVPNMVEGRDLRSDSRNPIEIKGLGSQERPATGTSVVWRALHSDYRGDPVSGALMRAEGADPVRPPGVPVFPKPGEMVVSPALADLFETREGALLRERFDQKIIGTIGDAGLLDPHELYVYLGNDTLTVQNGGTRITGYDERAGFSEPWNPILIVLIVLICVALLVPVAVFVAAAVRFGGDRRDRRLAALRLIGADTRSVRRIAAGEALFGALLGLVVGVGLFAAVRPLADRVQLYQLSAFPADVLPSPFLGTLVLVAVPVAAVAVTLVALRAVAIEPLGVVRNAKARPRRLWWRLLLPVAGIGLILAGGRLEEGSGSDAAIVPVAAGAVLVLGGLTTLLPWLIELLIGRVSGGPVPWQLAIRRLQLSSGAAARAVSGIMAAVAGGVALQMLFAGIEGDFRKETGEDPARARIAVTAKADDGAAREMVKELTRTEGVRKVTGVVQGFLYRETGPGHEPTPDDPGAVQVTVADCPSLRELATIRTCADGDTFVVHGPDPAQNTAIDRTAVKGKTLLMAERPTAETEPAADGDRDRSGAKIPTWVLPAGAPTVTAVPDAQGQRHPGVFATPGAIDAGELPSLNALALVAVDEGSSDAIEHVRNTAARVDPIAQVSELRAVATSKRFANVERGMLIGSIGTLGLIAASMLVSQLEQLRERRRLLSALVAFGTRRSTVAWSVLWQTAVPVVLGTAVAVVGGLGLGVVLLRMVGGRVADWWGFLPVAGAGGAVILVVTACSMPSLYRLMRPDGLRTE